MQKIRPHWSRIVLNGKLEYASDDMKVGIDVDQLCKYNGLLEGFLELDARGGFFRQKVLEKAFTELADDVDFAEAWKQAYEKQSWSKEDASRETAYSCRVMLSHLRIKHQAHLAGKGAGHPAELRALYQKISTEPGSTLGRDRARCHAHWP